MLETIIMSRAPRFIRKLASLFLFMNIVKYRRSK